MVLTSGWLRNARVSRHTGAVLAADTVAMIAHQGGWDEALFVGAPLLVFAGLLYLANKRANEQSSQPKSDD